MSPVTEPEVASGQSVVGIVRTDEVPTHKGKDVEIERLFGAI
jgi:hypothetical protein